VYRKIVLRTVSIAALVTITDICSRSRSRSTWRRSRLRDAGAARRGGAHAAVVELPREGLHVADHAPARRIVNWALDPFGLSGPGFGNVATWLVFSYLWLPFMVLPIYAGLERIPNSMLDASGDLGGHPWTTFRRVLLRSPCRRWPPARSSPSR
jgi:putative spermidine/putrescine transport system permease protein